MRIHTRNVVFANHRILASHVSGQAPAFCHTSYRTRVTLSARFFSFPLSFFFLSIKRLANHVIGVRGAVCHLVHAANTWWRKWHDVGPMCIAKVR